MNLSLRDTLIYAILSCYSDANGESRISREKIAQKAGIKQPDTVTNHTNKLVQEGLITKTYRYENGKRLVTYKVLASNQDYMWVSNCLMKYTPNEIGFLVKLAALR